eukprot:1156978-Pelagomonas_calceolata.AAC.4
MVGCTVLLLKTVPWTSTVGISAWCSWVHKSFLARGNVKKGWFGPADGGAWYGTCAWLPEPDQLLTQKICLLFADPGHPRHSQRRQVCQQHEGHRKPQGPLLLWCTPSRAERPQAGHTVSVAV